VASLSLHLLVLVLGDGVSALNGGALLMDGWQFLCLLIKIGELFQIDPGHFGLRVMQDIIHN
jgi:hypothetical protein